MKTGDKNIFLDFYAMNTKDKTWCLDLYLWRPMSKSLWNEKKANGKILYLDFYAMNAYGKT